MNENDNEGMDWAAYRRAEIRWRRWLASDEGQRTLRRLEHREAILGALRFALQGAGWVLVATAVAALLTVAMAW